MKVVIIAVLSMLLAVTYSQSLLNIFRENTKPAKLQGNKASPNNVFRPEKSLVFITDGKRLLVGGALVTTKFVITATYPLIKFVMRKESPTNLFIGIGTDPFDKNLDEYLHPVIDVKYDNEEICPAIYSIAIVMFQPILRRIPEDVQLIPVSLYIPSFRTHTVKALSVGWSKNGKIRKDLITKASMDVGFSITAHICKNNEHPELNDIYVGGFITCNKTLEGIIYNYKNSGPFSDEIELSVSHVQVSDRFINFMSKGELTLDDIQEEKDTYYTDSSYFSSDEDK